MLNQDKKANHYIDGHFTPAIGELNIYVSNLEEFNELLEQAKREARRLNETIDKLSTFSLKVNFTTVKDAGEQIE